ncbi:MAG: GGDEF domain-containing protein [Gammaproteobacteria bacterium]|nr:GGDEF domain-containing protein [Gammaproteobacteria bacterium]MCW8987038.1 GGDEF domain-containing protein [Gammaproteobacteria bacterium]
MILSWIFHHSREFNLFLLFTIIYIALDKYIWDSDLKVDRQLAYLLLVALIPINYLYNFLSRERGILNQYGIRRFVILAAQLYCIAWLLEHPYPPLKEFITFTYFKYSIFKITAITQPLIFALLFTGLILMFRLLQTSSILVSGIFSSFIAITTAMHFSQQPQLATMFVLIAGSLIIISITINAYSLAYLDELTNLPSRRALSQNISTLGKSYSIAMVDVDHFKKFNDKYGHDIGDQVLKKLASQLRQVRGGKAFRYGGEEFTLLFPNKNLHEAKMFCNELCKSVANSPFMLRNKKRPKSKQADGTYKRIQKDAKPLKITISIGLAERSQELLTAEEVIKQADKALYKAKNNGRNQVAI